MIYPMVPFPLILSDPKPRFQGHGVIIDALDVLCAQLTRDLFAIAKFLFFPLPLSFFLSFFLCTQNLSTNLWLTPFNRFWHV